MTNKVMRDAFFRDCTCRKRAVLKKKNDNIHCFCQTSSITNPDEPIILENFVQWDEKRVTFTLMLINFF